MNFLLQNRVKKNIHFDAKFKDKMIFRIFICYTPIWMHAHFFYFSTLLHIPVILESDPAWDSGISPYLLFQILISYLLKHESINFSYSQLYFFLFSCSLLYNLGNQLILLCPVLSCLETESPTSQQPPLSLKQTLAAT